LWYNSELLISNSRPFLAPEIFERKQYVASKVDVFACGIILFLMYCGYHPFNGEEACKWNNTMYGVLNTNEEKFWSAHVNAKPHIDILKDPNFKDLIVKMLDIKPENRLSMEEIMEHPFVKGDVPSNHVIKQWFGEQKVNKL